MNHLQKTLNRIEGKGYKAYKDIKGNYQFDDFEVCIDHVQGDPFAAPSRVSVKVPTSTNEIPQELWSTNISNDDHPIRKTALEDFLGRCVLVASKQIAKGRRGSGGSGLIAIETSGQQVLLRNAVIVTPQFIEIRIVMGLPANGRRVAAMQASEMFFKELPQILSRGTYYRNLDKQALDKHINNIEDQHVLRQWLDSENLVSFIADESVLPRLSGINDRPLEANVIKFKSPPSLKCGVTLPNAGNISGMGIKKGITLIVGGGFHGKSTLLHAIERGVYNHIPGDGRDQVVTTSNAVKVRAEDGRSISRVNISPFIDRLPFAKDTHSFSTENASGSTSQAANIIEAYECGTQLLLIDEDTSATNFMIRDERMQALVSQDKEPITPLLYRVRELYVQHGVSSIIVMGGSGDYFDVADYVVMMDSYQARDVTQQAQALAKQLPDNIRLLQSKLPEFTRQSPRKPGRAVLNPARRNRAVKIDAKDLTTILYGEHKIDLALVEQLVDFGQTRAIGLVIHYYATHYADRTNNSQQNLIDGLEQVFSDIHKNGLDILSEYKVGSLAMPRLHEVAAAINRIREGQWQ